MNSTDGQEQGAHTQEEENRPQSPSQAQREVQTGQNPQKGPGSYDDHRHYSAWSFHISQAAVLWGLVVHFDNIGIARFSDRCGMSGGRIKDTAESCLVFVLVLRRAPNWSNHLNHESENPTEDCTCTSLLLWEPFCHTYDWLIQPSLFFVEKASKYFTVAATRSC